MNNKFKKINKRNTTEECNANFNKLIRETTGLIILFNLRNYNLRLNKNILMNLAMKNYLDYLKGMTLKEAMLFLRNDILDYSSGDDNE